jgi:hypothetical protein
LIVVRLKYDGQWVQGQWNGSGVLTCTSGDVYEGQFVKNALEGGLRFTTKDFKATEGG